MRTSLLFVSLLVVVATARPSRACLSPKDLATMRANQARAAAAGCTDAIVHPGHGIGLVYLGQETRSAAQLARDGITFESHDGKVTRIVHTANNVCISSGFLAPLLVIDPGADLAAHKTEGLALVRGPRGIRAEVTAGRTRRE